MKILYGICGEGFGHSSRAKSVLDHLKKSGHKVLVLTYGQAYKTLKKYRPIDIFGIEPQYKNGRMSFWKSLFHNQSKLLPKSKDFPSLKKEIDKFNPDICISDMEPLVPIISFWYKLPLISIDNQHKLIFTKTEVPLRYKKDFFIAKFFIKRCISKANYFLILSFNKEKVKEKNVFFVNPLLRKEILRLKPQEKKFILVYLSKPDKKIIETLKKTKASYIVYGQKNAGKSKNILYKKKGKQFLQDLKNCKAIIATAGFSLISEALYLKKPYFATPLKGQFEQAMNSFHLKESGFGEYSEEPTKEEIEAFISKIPKIKRNLKSYKSDPKEALEILDRILKKFVK